jgi:carboxypeptidase Taq
MSHSKLNELKQRLMEVYDLYHTASLLHWDQATYMPPGGAAARARQMALITRLAHEKFTDPAIGKLLDQLHHYEQSLPYDSDEASLIRVTRRHYERETKLPARFVAELSAHQAASYQLWCRARPANDFRAVQPYLEKTLELSRQLANFFPGYEHIADPLIDYADFGMKASTVRPLFGELRAALLPIVENITAQSPADDSCLRQHFPEPEQLAFSRRVLERLGYDFQRGRMDKTPHPFMTKFSLGDVRITTRVNERFFGEALFSSMHEAGHALYEQGIHPRYEATPLGSGTSSGVHESQSRLWENLVGRSRNFWEFFYPKLQQTFPAQLGAVPLQSFYRAINKVERSLIRTEADELTYNLHVMIRFDLELELLEGTLAVKDLPEAWRARYQSDLGIAPPDDRDGVLQDVHWYGGLIGGAFHSYTVGNLMAAQFFEAAVRACPQIPQQIAQGEFGTLLGWLREHIYQHGSKFTADELLRRVTGGPLSVEPHIRYLRRKFGELYRL